MYITTRVSRRCFLRATISGQRSITSWLETPVH
jgi:hypothetical protein